MYLEELLGEKAKSEEAKQTMRSDIERLAESLDSLLCLLRVRLNWSGLDYKSSIQAEKHEDQARYDILQAGHVQAIVDWRNRLDEAEKEISR